MTSKREVFDGCLESVSKTDCSEEVNGKVRKKSLFCFVLVSPPLNQEALTFSVKKSNKISKYFHASTGQWNFFRETTTRRNFIAKHDNGSVFTGDNNRGELRPRHTWCVLTLRQRSARQHAQGYNA